MKKRLITILFLFILSVNVFGHGVNIKIIKHYPTVIIKSSFDDGKPFAYASVSIYAPDSTKTQYQSAWADANGIFVFVPDKSGNWKFEVDDEMGHVEEIIIPISQEFFKANKKSNSFKNQNPYEDIPVYFKIIFGIGLIFGMTGIFYWVKAKNLIAEKGQ